MKDKHYAMILFLLFITLKLTGVGIIQYWSYWWVFSPIWGYAILKLLQIIIGAIILTWVTDEDHDPEESFKSRLQKEIEKRQK